MKSFIVFFLIILTCVSNTTRINSNLNNDNADECFSAIVYVSSDVLSIALDLIAYPEQKEDTLEDIYYSFNEMIDSKIDYDHYCPLVIDQCKDALLDFLSNAKLLYSSIQSRDYLNIAKSLVSLYEDVQNIEQKCDFSVKTKLRNSLEDFSIKSSKFSKLSSQKYKTNDDKDVCVENVILLYMSIVSAPFDIFNDREAFIEDIQNIQESILLIKENCTKEIITKCKNDFADAKDKVDIFYNYLMTKDYDTARSYVETIVQSTIKARLSCLPADDE